MDLGVIGEWMYDTRQDQATNAFENDFANLSNYVDSEKWNQLTLRMKEKILKKQRHLAVLGA